MLYIMRHGQTDWNIKKKLQGRCNIPLNKKGEEMALEAKEKYKDIHIDICYSSPLIRAERTAEIFLEGRNVRILTDERLMEMSFGVFEGEEDVLNRKELEVYKMFYDPENYHPEERAESFESLYKRTGEFISDTLLPLLKEGKDVLVLGHGAMNLSIINQLLGIPLERFWQHFSKNCEIVPISLNDIVL